VTSVEKVATAYENVAASPTTDQLVITRPDARGVYQFYTGTVGGGEPATCISCRRVLISADVDMTEAEGQDQFVLDVDTGQLQNLTRSPDVWDEHGLFSPDGSKITFMSSYPYRHQKDSNKVASLKTEFMVMNADGSDLQQVTHFNEPGHPESLSKNTVAAVAQFVGDGSRSFATVMAPDYSFGKTNWVITFAGRCGQRTR